MNPPARQFKNRILAALPKAEIERLKPHLSPVTLVQEETLLDGEARARLLPGRRHCVCGHHRCERRHS